MISQLVKAKQPAKKKRKIKMTKTVDSSEDEQVNVLNGVDNLSITSESDSDYTTSSKHILEIEKNEQQCCFDIRESKRGKLGHNCTEVVAEITNASGHKQILRFY